MENQPKFNIDTVSEAMTENPAFDQQMVRVDLQDDEPSRRLIANAARRIISQHEAELKALAYK